MKQIQLNEYDNISRKLILFDILIKEENTNKDVFLDNLNISVSSYRRAKISGNKIGNKIIEVLCQHFSVNNLDSTQISSYEKRINEIYFNIYYKNYETYNTDLEWLDIEIKKKNILFPIFRAMKLLLDISRQFHQKSIYSEFKDEYNEISKYRSYFNEELLSILEVFDIFFKQIIDFTLSSNYKNDLSYYILSTKCIYAEKYIESLYFANLAKEKYLSQENYKRVYYINLNIMLTYNCLKNYKECNELALKQLYSLESKALHKYEYGATLKHYLTSCFGLGKYNEIVTTIEKMKTITPTEICCLLISKYILDKDGYNKYFNDNFEVERFDDDSKELLFSINEYLFSKNDRIFEVLAKNRITTVLINLIKNLKI